MEQTDRFVLQTARATVMQDGRLVSIFSFTVWELQSTGYEPIQDKSGFSSRDAARNAGKRALSAHRKRAT